MNKKIFYWYIFFDILSGLLGVKGKDGEKGEIGELFFLFCESKWKWTIIILLI